MTINNRRPAKILLVDNYDSFTYNIVQLLLTLKIQPTLILNDERTLADVQTFFQAQDYTHLIISPGPGHPKQAGVSLELIQLLAPAGIPILGICLGHQAIAEAFGASVGLAKDVSHGKISKIEHSSKGLFKNLPSPFNVTRYHSLIVEDDLPSSLEVVAWHQREDGSREIMGLQHQTLPCFGVQFHPEAILSEYGYELLNNFCNTIPSKNM